MSPSPQDTVSALAALGQHLAALGAPALELVVCGGSGLQLLGFIDRPKQDVDVLALAQTGPSGKVDLLSADELPALLLQAASVVARDLGLLPDWLNAKPAGMLGMGLPRGFVDRLHRRRFGKHLIVH